MLNQLSGAVPIARWVAFQVFVGFGEKAGGAEAEKDQVLLTGIGDSVSTVRGDKHYVAGVHFPGGQAAGLHQPLFIIHTGDFVKSGDPVEYDNYRKQIAALDIPIVHLPGNHDVRSGPEPYHQYVGEANWYFDLGDIRFIGLDNGSGKFTPEAVALARETLTNQKTCLVAFHYHLYDEMNIDGRMETVVKEELRLGMFRVVAGGDLFKVLSANLIGSRFFDLILLLFSANPFCEKPVKNDEGFRAYPFQRRRFFNLKQAHTPKPKIFLAVIKTT